MINQIFLEDFIASMKPESFSFKNLRGIDRWESWSPIRVGWTDVGAPTVTGLLHVVGQQCFFQVEVIPFTSVATVAGTSYIELPIAAQGLCGDGSMVNAATLVAIGNCAFDVANSRVYVPAQIATGDTLTIGGWFEI